MILRTLVLRGHLTRNCFCSVQVNTSCLFRYQVRNYLRCIFHRVLYSLKINSDKMVQITRKRISDYESRKTKYLFHQKKKYMVMRRKLTYFAVVIEAFQIRTKLIEIFFLT